MAETAASTASQIDDLNAIIEELRAVEDRIARARVRLEGRIIPPDESPDEKSDE